MRVAHLGQVKPVECAFLVFMNRSAWTRTSCVRGARDVSAVLTMAFEASHGVLVVAHGMADPSVGEWSAYCAAIPGLYPNISAVLVYTAGGAPSSKQREQMRSATPGPPPPTAIVTGSALVRGIVTSLNWFFPTEARLTTFAPREIDAALRHVSGGNTMRYSVAERTLSVLGDRLGLDLSLDRREGSERPSSVRPPDPFS